MGVRVVDDIRAAVDARVATVVKIIRGRKMFEEQEKEDKEHCFEYAEANFKGEVIKYLIIIVNYYIIKLVIFIVEKVGYDS